MLTLYEIMAVLFQILNLIRHPTSYTAAWLLAISSFVFLCVGIIIKYRIDMSMQSKVKLR